jgi:PhzF family phenazine biosynthesis protein
VTREIFQVDAFAACPFEGNPAAVCILESPADESWMQQVAAEMNLSETAFLYPENNGYRLRWFTPVVEVSLCGHATLASAHILWEEGHLPHDRPARFHTKSDLLTATKVGDRIELNFPSHPVTPSEAAPGLLEALGVEARFVGQSRADKLLIEVASESAVRACRPDFNSLARSSTTGIIITARADSARYDFISRFFAPAVGINEDPVTGAAHCSLGPYWSANLGKRELLGYQASARGGEVYVRVEGERTVIGGRAVTVMRCRLLV